MFNLCRCFFDLMTKLNVDDDHNLAHVTSTDYCDEYCDHMQRQSVVLLRI